MTDVVHQMAEVGDRLRLGRLSRPTASEPTRIAVIGDPHVAVRSEGTCRVFHRTEACLRRAIDDVNARDPDLVVFPGDLTKDGEPWNYDRVDELLDRLEHPFVAVAGNHDVEKRTDQHRSLDPSAFAERYGVEPLPARIPVDDVDLFVVDSVAGPEGPYVDTHRGLVSAEQVRWLDRELEDATEPVVVCHHNPLPLVSSPLRETRAWRTFTMRERERLVAVLARHDVPLVLSGHHHVPSLVERHGLTQVIAPAAASYPQAYCLLELDDTGADVWLVSHATSDERAEAYRLAREGPSLYRAFLAITEASLADLPLVHEPPELDRSALADSERR